MKLIKSYLTKNRCYTRAIKIDIKGIMVHSTGVAQPNVAPFLTGWNNEEATKCVHAFVTRDNVVQTLPWNYKGWHAGGPANESYIGFEILEPAGHTYANGSTMVGYDVIKNRPYFDAVYQNAVELCAMLCKKYDLDPIANILCHSEGYKKGIASNHADVMHWFPKHKKTMDDFRKDVKKEIEAEKNPSPGDTNSKPTTEKTYYRVQIGSFMVKEYAEKLQQKANKEGLKTVVIKQDNSYVVRIGSFVNKDNANAARDKAKKLGFAAAIVRTTIKTTDGQNSNNTNSDQSYKVKVTAKVLNVRIGAGTSYAIATTVKKDEIYTIVETKNGWGRLKSGAGWISLNYTTKL